MSSLHSSTLRDISNVNILFLSRCVHLRGEALWNVKGRIINRRNDTGIWKPGRGEEEDEKWLTEGQKST
ncbi:unnamed protein product [Cylicocyclus nassatus]|uniref:Uncharacterized protein n=1 Tax=Cylicocyclus nassatus TaxID=53992 RepID=A0AA36HFK2_CYLNA|nr:unnamed protein product [Cylicocyclus nassatus]